MRTRLPGFDPYQNGWDAYGAGGLGAVEQIEAPLLMFTAEPRLAVDLADKYEKEGLQPIDLRVGVWPDAFPQPTRSAEELEKLGGPAVHLNVFGARQARYSHYTEPERRLLDELTAAITDHVDQIINPEFGVSVQEFNRQVPTAHRHVIARELDRDGLDWQRKRTKIEVPERHTMRERVDFSLVPGRREQIVARLGVALQKVLNEPQL